MGVTLDPLKVNAISVCAFGGMADCLRIVPYLRATRERFPTASIRVLTETWGNDLFASCPYIDEVVCLPALRPDRSNSDALRRLVAGVHFVRRKADLLFSSPYRIRRAALLSLFSGARYRIGYRIKGIPFAWTVDTGPMDHSRSTEERLDRLWREIGIDRVDSQLEMWHSSEDEAHIDEFLESHQVHSEDTLVGLHPGSDWGCQQWHPRNWANLGDELQSQFGAKVVVTGTKDDHEDYKQLTSLMSNTPISAIGKTTVEQLAYLVSRFRLLITVDSILVPLGIAAGIPVIVLNFSNMSSWRKSRWPNLISLHPPSWFPELTLNERCKTDKLRHRIDFCRLAVCVGTQGARLISVRDVISKLEPLLKC